MGKQGVQYFKKCLRKITIHYFRQVAALEPQLDSSGLRHYVRQHYMAPVRDLWRHGVHAAVGVALPERVQGMGTNLSTARAVPFDRQQYRGRDASSAQMFVRKWVGSMESRQQSSAGWRRATSRPCSNCAFRVARQAKGLSRTSKAGSRGGTINVCAPKVLPNPGRPELVLSHDRQRGNQ